MSSMEGQYLVFLFALSWYEIKGCFGILYRFVTDFLTTNLFIPSYQFLLDIAVFAST
jgi:hypothetical protein